MGIPDSLQHYIDLFVANGQFFRNGTEMFGLTSWVQVMRRAPHQVRFRCSTGAYSRDAGETFVHLGLQ